MQKFTRILAICFILFLAIFALDSFQLNRPLTESLIAFIMHLVPNYLLIIALIVAWKKEKVGGILFLLLGVFFTFFFRTYVEVSSFLAVSAPAFFIGILFIVSQRKKGK